MASENETVEEVVCDMRAYDSGEIADVWMRRFADRIESAWRRERKQLIDENQLYKQELTHERTKTNLAKSEVAELRRTRRNFDRFANAEEMKEFLRTHSVNRNHSIFIDGVKYSSAYVWLFAPVAEGGES